MAEVCRGGRHRVNAHRTSSARRSRAHWSVLESMSERSARRACQWLLALYAATALLTGLQAFASRHDNNFVMFSASFHHLLAGADLYAAYPAEYFDRFKYSPSFSLLFAPFASLPPLAGVALWNLVNAGSLGLAITRLLPPRAAAVALAAVYLEMLGAAQNAQSNALVTAMVVFAFLALEAKRPAQAALAIAAGTVIKLFPAAAVTLAIPRPKRLAFALGFAGIMALLIALPLPFTGAAGLAAQYRSWFAIEQLDAAAGLTPGDGRLIGGVMQQLRLWFGVDWANWPVQLAGTIVLVLPLLMRRRRWPDTAFRLRYLASLLIYMVIFNHQAESSSFVIAMTGIAIWFAAGAWTRARAWLFAASWFVISFASSSLTPASVRHDIVLAYGLKAVPCIAVWVALQFELMGSSRRSESREVDALEPLQRPAHGG
jgi:hypothetical protein